jgi:hypothetical protein
MRGAMRLAVFIVFCWIAGEILCLMLGRRRDDNEDDV